jgi:uncharacterized protein (DUF58 family)
MHRAVPSLSLLHKLEWRVRRAAESPLGCEYRCAFRGRGREFDQVVKYEYGDQVRDMDWNVTARLGEPYRKKFIEERDLTVVVLLEDSLSLQFGSGRRTKRDTLLEMAGLFALLSAGSRDRVGFWHATPHTQLVRQPVRGRTNILNTTAHLLSLPLPALDAGGEVDIDWKYFLQAFPPRSVVLWLSDFPPRPLPAAWAALSRRYQMIGVRVEDPWERVSPHSGDRLPVALRSRATPRRQEEWVARRDAYWDQIFPFHVARLTVSTEDDLLEALIRFFRARLRAAHAPPTA